MWHLLLKNNYHEIKSNGNFENWDRSFHFFFKLLLFLMIFWDIEYSFKDFSFFKLDIFRLWFPMILELLKGLLKALLAVQ